MTIKIRIIRAIIKWLWEHYRYLILDVCLPGAHVHKNPARKKPAHETIEVNEGAGCGDA